MEGQEQAGRGDLMPRLPRHLIDEVRHLTRLSTLVGRHVKLKKVGAQWMGTCPFHQDSKPSLSVNDGKGVYYCFGCGAHGDLFTFVMETQGMTFQQAAEHLAVAAGLMTPDQAGRPKPVQRNPQEEAQARADWREQARQREAKAQAKQKAAAEEVNKTLSTCTPQFHPYLASKGFPDLMAPVTPSGQRLVIPVWNAQGEIRSAQYIRPDGTKRFQPGGQIKGNFHRIGRHYEVWLCEGYATGLSIHAALRARYIPAEIRVCFSANNLKVVGRALKMARRRVLAVADHDSSGVGLQAAQAVTQACWQPDVEGRDANDVHQARGLSALANALRTFWLENKETR